MKAEWRRYLTEIGMGRPLVGRVARVERAVAAVCDDKIRDLFVSDYLEENQTRRYEGLFFFTDKAAIQASRFVSEDTLDIDLIANCIVNLAISRTDFDFEETTEKSRLRVVYATAGHCGGELKASKENCAHLAKIVRQRLVPNLSMPSLPLAVR